MATALLGIKLLVAAFDSSDFSREWLLKEVQGKFVGVKEETALPFVAVLSLLVHKHPKAVLQHAALLKVRSRQAPDVSMHINTVLSLFQGAEEQIVLPYIAVLSLLVHKHPKAVLQPAQGGLNR